MKKAKKLFDRRNFFKENFLFVQFLNNKEITMLPDLIKDDYTFTFRYFT